ncbi:MAG TPA: Hsp33 family molecular chaperone HslO [Acetobacteraceae bacterium]|nr:Hsp33 family molecular chaperone HslO [Acetobacteraceae bacterium]
MADPPAFLDRMRPAVPDIVVPRAVLPFFLPRCQVRGRLVRLGPLAEVLLARHRHPPVIASLAGQALALVAGLAISLKFRGSFSLQAKGDGPVPHLLVDCTDGGALRFYARTDPDRLGRLLAADPAPPASALLGQGYLAFTVDPRTGARPHQGIVSISGESFEEMALAYFRESVQLAGLVRLAASPLPVGWRAGALILERIPKLGGAEAPEETAESEDAWRTAIALVSTLSDSELLDDGLAPERLLYRLFHGEGITADRPRSLAYGCRCTRERLSGVLAGFAADDLDHMATDGTITVTCEFCNHDFRFLRSEFPDRGAAD